jgi:hypothetical protein
MALNLTALVDWARGTERGWGDLKRKATWQQ